MYAPLLNFLNADFVPKMKKTANPLFESG